MKEDRCLLGLLFVMLIMTVKINGQVGPFANDFDVIVDLTSVVGDLSRLWDSTGLSPPGPGEEAVEYLTSNEQMINLALIGSLPFKAISHIRIHWMLDLINVNKANDHAVIYDYTLIDHLICWLKEHRLRPGFELMGNPGGLFSDLNTNPKTVVMWQHLISDLAAHFIEKFGLDEIMKWRFELWNEPDSKQYNILNLTTSGYMNYAVASMKGLAQHKLKTSGPAGTFKDLEHHNISWSLLQLCDSMISISGSCSLDTITFHKKGGGVAQNVVSSTAEFYSLATQLYPNLKQMPFANNEADILTGWWNEESWRGDVNYAAAVCEVIAEFLSQVFKQNHFKVAYISNDNGFINDLSSYFNQRTLLTRFQMNNSVDLHNQFIRKPVMVAMAMLSYLGPKEIPVFLRHLTRLKNYDSRLSVLAAGDGVEIGPGWSAAVILAVSALANNCSDKTISLRLKLPPQKDLKYVIYQIDNVITNPRNVWEKSGKKQFPDFELFRKMREHEGPQFLQMGDVIGEWEEIFLKAKCPSITLVHSCVKPIKPPAKVLNLHAINITFNDVLLMWQDSDTRKKCFCEDDYQLITDRDIIMLAYQFSDSSNRTDTVEGTRGRYKVRARDYWDQLGSFSDVLVYPLKK